MTTVGDDLREADLSRSWRVGSRDVRVPVCLPELPAVHLLEPYLREIGERRVYSNGGPLVRRFEGRLAEHLGIDQEGVVTVSSGTSGLAAALMGGGAARGSLCMLPAWTFVATAHAALQAGLVPWMVDVDAADGILSPEEAERRLASAPGEVGAVVVVAPFGRPVSAGSWEVFQHKTGIPVALDAAAGFDSIIGSAIPTVVSLHATKPLGVGEGGFVACSDIGLASQIRSLTNFGFRGTREAFGPALNAKMSEYTAAVGLAALDEWPRQRARLEVVAAAYRVALAGTGARMDPGFGSDWLSSTINVRLDEAHLEAAEDALALNGIDSRRWWGGGLGQHAGMLGFPRTDLPVTRYLAASTLGLPFWPGLPTNDVHVTADLVTAAGRT